MNGTALRHLVEARTQAMGGGEPARRRASGLVAQRLVEALWDDNDPFEPGHFSIREAWEALVGGITETLPQAATKTRAGFISEAPLSTGAFSIITGNVIARAVMQAYRAVAGVLDQLVTPAPSTMRIERYVGFTAEDADSIVREGEDYPEVGLGEKWVQGPEPDKRGKIISITAEMVVHDQTGHILTRAARLGESMRTARESEGLNNIADSAGYKCYYPESAQVDIYRTAAGSTVYTRNITELASNALVDWTNVNAAMAILAARKDEKGKLILVQPTVILVPFALAATLARIMTATEVRYDTNNAADTANRVTVSGGQTPLRAIFGGAMPTPLVSPALDAISTSSWYVGDFRRCFNEQIIWPIQVFQQSADSESGFNRDVVTRFKVRRKSRIHCVDDTWLLRSTT